MNVFQKLKNSLNSIYAKYLNNDFPITLDLNNKPMESKEAVFYFNSVSDIIRVIKKHKLTSSNTLIICSRT